MLQNHSGAGGRVPAVRTQLLKAASIAALAIGGFGFSGHAQAQTSAGAAATDNTTTVQTIIVTAEKRSVNLQKVPVAVSAVTAADALARGLTGTESLTAAVPGLVINSPANVGNPFLRGVGTNLADPSSEQSVALYVDGVYIASPLSNLFSFNSIDHVEVEKGPQGTLFGRNATGGVIQIITKDPSQHPSGMLSAGYGNYNDVTASGYFTTGITDNLAADFAFLAENQGDGYGHNLTTGSKTYQEAMGNYALRSKAVYQPTDKTKITVSVDYAHAESDSSYQKPPGTSSIDGKPYPGSFNSVGDLPDDNAVNTGGASLQIKQQFGALNAVSITSYRNTQDIYKLDDDVSSLPVADVVLYENAHNWSQELQLSGPDHGWFKWLVGGYYFNGVGGYYPVLVNGAEQVRDQQSTNSLAGFGQATATVFTDTNLTVGVRYTDETQKLQLYYPAALNQSETFDKLTFRIALDHRFTDDILGYVSFNRGFKSGGFNLLDPGNDFRPETLDATEVGLKTELFDHRLRLNLAAFSYDYSDIQLELIHLGFVTVSNAAAAHIKGLEAEFEYVPVHNLSIAGGLSLLDGKYTNYPNAIPLNQDGVAQPTINEAGNHTVMTPPITANFNVQYKFVTSIGAIKPAVTVIYNDGFSWESDNRLKQPSYTLLNTSVTWTNQNNDLDVRVWAKNLTNATYYISRNESAGLGDNEEQAPPRTYGVTLTKHFR
jgi:iron complex outermembrane receptor protein